MTERENMSTNKKKPAASSDEKASNNSNTNKNAVSDQQVRQESSKAANAAATAQKKAKELRKAAAGAGDPDERQKLMEQAIDAEIEAESFGKTAKYLRSGAFQGAAVGTGLGVAPSATLGALTGTLVGGVTSVITGGLGCGIGAAAGAAHGPMVNLGQLAGKGVRKVTGDLPGWVASDEQKQALEKMIGQVKEEEMPDEEELKKLREEGGDAVPDEGWMDSAKGMLPSMGGASKSSGISKGSGKGDSKQPHTGNSMKETDTSGRKKPRKLESKTDDSSAVAKKKPRKLEARANDSNGTSSKTANTQSHPRKLEARS
jgi:hypothetical protein